MANQMKRSSESMQVTERHGAAGHYVIRADVPGWVKDSLIDIAEARGLSFKAVVLAAFEDYIHAEHGEAA